MNFKEGNDRDSDVDYPNIISDLGFNDKNFDPDENYSVEAKEDDEDNPRPEFNEVEVDDPQQRLRKKKKKRRKSFIYQNILNRDSRVNPRD